MCFSMLHLLIKGNVSQRVWMAENVFWVFFQGFVLCLLNPLDLFAELKFWRVMWKPSCVESRAPD